MPAEPLVSSRKVDEHQADDLAEGERHDRQIVAAEPQHREAEHDAPEARQGCRRGAAGSRTRQAEMRGEQRIGIGADGIEGDVAEIEQAGEADDDVEAPAEHHVDQDLDAEIVDPFQRALEAEQADARSPDRERGRRGRPAENQRVMPARRRPARSCGRAGIARLAAGDCGPDRRSSAGSGRRSRSRR